ncbi:MAG: phosphatase PAP2 family protein [Bacteroidales bacterium]|nr:phosphatase PAP2 family protein [Bacteroidales bacterium]
MHALEQLDRNLTLLINGWNSPFSDPIWSFISDIPVWIPMYAAIVVFLIVRLGWKKGLIVVAAALLTFGFCDQFSNLIKDMTERLRPCNDPYMLNNGLHVLESGGVYGFFSAHAANAFGLAASTYIGIRMDKRLKYHGYAVWMFTWATLVAISRVFVGKHFLGDVIIGTIVGLAAGIAFGHLARWVCKRFLQEKTQKI